MPQVNEWQNRPLDEYYPFVFMDAINAVYPFPGIQRCIIHQIRSSSKFVSYKHIKEIIADFKKIYSAVAEEEALENL